MVEMSQEMPAPAKPRPQEGGREGGREGRDGVYLEQATSYGHALFLAPGELEPAFAHDGVVA